MAHELAQGQRRCIGQQPRLGLYRLGEAGQDLGVDPVCLRQPAGGAGKLAYLTRVHYRYGQARVAQRRPSLDSIAARRLQHDHAQGQAVQT